MLNNNDTSYETDTEADITHLMAGRQITLDEIAVELAAIELRLRQISRAAETPATPVELVDARLGYLGDNPMAVPGVD
ncbi:hypothetical protein [Streptomyces olivaceus]|uniref:hypothetical protein n=1 Tax=Streptomyces olivaceus TaxID=47716 RepID=UPI0022EDCF56|nr:hypothetical protein [Streptomyces olivaceus]GHI98033.1 hypothetical protein TPA0905_75040 [Streptomyces olivaceus]